MKIKRFIFFIVFLFLFNFVLKVEMAKAEWPINCGDPLVGKIFAVFFLTDENGGNKQGICVPVSVEQTFINFNALSSANPTVIPQLWNFVDANMEKNNCMTGALYSEDEHGPFDVQASELSYYLSQSIQEFCPATQQNTFVNVRYRFEPIQGGNRYLYFDSLRGNIDDNSSFVWQGAENLVVEDIEKIEQEFTIVAKPSDYDFFEMHGMAPNYTVVCQGCPSDEINIELEKPNVKIIFYTHKYFERHKPRTFPTKVSYLLVGEILKNGLIKKSTYSLSININPADCSKKTDREVCGRALSLCFWLESDKKCVSTMDENVCTKLPKSLCGTDIGSSICKWDDLNKKCSVPTVAISLQNQYPVPEGASGLLPACAYSGQCRNINQLLEVVINAGKILLSMAAGLAFVMFVYGGFTWVLSFGNSEKVEKGKSIFTSATIGLVIAFSAYMLVDFLLKVLQVKESFIGL